MRVRHSFFLGLSLFVSSLAAFAIEACGSDASDASPEGSDGSVIDVGTGGDDSSQTPDDSSMQSDTGPTGPCDLAADFGTPVAVAGLETLDSVARFSEDELTAYFAVYTTDGGPRYLARAMRGTLGGTFGAAEFLPTSGAPLVGFQPSLTIDAKSLYFAHSFDGGTTNIFVAERVAADASFGGGALALGAGSSSSDVEPFIAASGDLWFSSSRMSSSTQVWRAPSSGSGFGTPGEPANVNPSGTNFNEYPILSHDGLTLYFTNTPIDPIFHDADIWFAKRPSPTSDFFPPAILPNVNTTGNDRSSWLSPDGCRLYIGRGLLANAPISMFVASKPAN